MKNIQINPASHKINIHSDTWKAVAAWAEKELMVGREQNDKIKLDMVKTSVIRGKIKVLKEILQLPETKR